MPLGAVNFSGGVSSIFSRVRGAYREFDVAAFHKASKGWGSTFWAAMPFCGEYKVYEADCRALQRMIEDSETKLTAIRDKINRIVATVNEPTKMADDGTLVGDLKPMLAWRNTIIREIANHGTDAVIGTFMSDEFQAALAAANATTGGTAVEMQSVSASAPAPAPAPAPGSGGTG